MIGLPISIFITGDRAKAFDWISVTTVCIDLSVSRFTETDRNGPKRTGTDPESPFRSVPVRFGQFLYPLKSVSVPRKSVSISTKVRFGPFRSVWSVSVST